MAANNCNKERLNDSNFILWDCRSFQIPIENGFIHLFRRVTTIFEFERESQIYFGKAKEKGGKSVPIRAQRSQKFSSFFFPVKGNNRTRFKIEV